MCYPSLCWPNSLVSKGIQDLVWTGRALTSQLGTRSIQTPDLGFITPVGVTVPFPKPTGGLWSSLLWLRCRAFPSLLEYDTVTKEVKVLLDQLRFPNGVQLSPEEDFVLVAETTMARIRRCVCVVWTELSLLLQSYLSWLWQDRRELNECLECFGSLLWLPSSCPSLCEGHRPQCVWMSCHLSSLQSVSLFGGLWFFLPVWSSRCVPAALLAFTTDTWIVFSVHIFELRPVLCLP